MLAFILEPLVARAPHHRTAAAALVYLALAALVVILISLVLPTTVSQISQLAALVPTYLPQNSFLTARVESFLATTANNSLVLASGVASTATNIFLIFILSFYLLISKKGISQFILDVIPDEYEGDYRFLEKTLNQTFASFLQVQVILGLIIGAIALIVLLVLQVDFALTTAILSAILAMIPVVGPIIFLIPVILATMTVSLQTMFIGSAIILTLAQLAYNILAPKLLGNALKIHPIVVLLSFVIGYRLGGVWGAIFAVPVTSALVIISKDLLKYWKEEADH